MNVGDRVRISELADPDDIDTDGLKLAGREGTVTEVNPWDDASELSVAVKVDGDDTDTYLFAPSELTVLS